MRPGLAFGVGATALAATLSGCTFLIPFDEERQGAPGVDSSIGRDASTDAVPDTATAADADATPPVFPPPCDLTFPLAQVNCNGATRPNCAKSTFFTSYPAGYDRTNDRVVCNGAPTPQCVEHCPFGCAEMPPGYDDQCDDCNGRADGFYCGRDLRGWDPSGADLAVECVNGKTVKGSVCGVGRCASVCTRVGGPRPSCCF
jgi:hypothetical protein